MNRLPLACTAALILVCSGPAIAARAQESFDFDRDVRPILSDNCFQCHGPDGAARQADLRLDTEDGLFATGKDGRIVVVPGHPERSELFRRITAADGKKMPPPESELSLSVEQIETIRHWIASGAAWSGHWAFQPPTRPELPRVEHSDWPRNPIDHFILARLESAGLMPAPAASRETLIRRVTLDLTGLPPTPGEIDEFLAASATDPDAAYEALVDRLLASPRYGERMAWEWLDAARYADTDGFQGDPTRQMWPWRDWLISALNNNMPFDEFTIEMLAGDLLPDPTPEQILATGFNRNHMYNGEGGRIAEETRVENVFDRTETTATVWLGLTMTCARCHDHKFDPISQEEYYQFYAFFNNTSESGRGGGGRAAPTLRYLQPEARQRIANLEQEIAVLDQQLSAPLADIDEAQAEWEIGITAELAQSGDTDGKIEVGPWHVLGPIPAPDGDSGRAFREDLGPEAGVDLDAAYHDGEFAWHADPGISDGKVHALPTTIGATYLYRTLTAPGKRTIHVSLGSDDGIRVWLNGGEVLTNDAFRVAAPDQEKLTLDLRPGENELLIKVVNRDGAAGVYFKKTGETVAGLPQDILQILALDAAVRSEQQATMLRRFYRVEHWEEGRRLAKELARLEAERKQINDSAADVMVMDMLPADKRRTVFVLDRGTYNKPLSTEVSPGTPAFLPPLPQHSTPNRLTLAKWLVHPDNPLTARVTVNRYWQIFFGRGLVETSEDFGRQGSRPTHPELLDWLATHFIDIGWDVKALHKLIVTSAAYRQSSRLQLNPDETPNPDSQIASFPRTRMPSWMLRDQALAVSGLLVERIGGPPVKPYQPDGIWAEATFGKIRYVPDQGDALYRRSLYVFWRRIVGPTMLFDTAKRQTCEVKPIVTNTPLHALTTLNETLFVEAARKMAERVMTSGGSTDEERLSYAFRLVTARYPDSDELSVLMHRLDRLVDHFAACPDDAAKLLAVGESPRDGSLDPAQHAAYSTLCNLLLNLDETLTRE